MNDYRLSDLLDLDSIQRMAESHYKAAGMPVGIIDAGDESVLVGTGWQDICTKFHRANPASRKQCRQEHDDLRIRLARGESCTFKCENGLWKIGLPIIVAGRHLATMLLGQFFFDGEAPDRDFFINQAREFGFDLQDYLAALDRVPVFNREKVDAILEYDRALAGFISDLATHALSKIKAEETARDRERKFPAVFDHTRQFFGLLSPDGRLLEANRTALQFSGVDKSRVIGRFFWETPWWGHSPELQATVRQAVRQAAGGEMVAFEATHPDATGSLRYFDFSIEPVKDENGRVVMLIPEGRDITERRQAEQENRRQAEYLRLFIDTMPCMVYSKDRQGRYMSCNWAFAAFYGLTRDQVAGKTAYDIAPAELADFITRGDKMLFEKPGTQMYEGWAESSDGVRHSVLVHKATFDGPDGKPMGIVGAVMDISQRKQAEDALSTSEIKIRSILDSIEIGVTLISPQMEVLEVNHRMRQWFPNVDPGAGALCYHTFKNPPRDGLCEDCQIYKTLQDGRVRETITRTKRDGKPCHYRIISSPVFNKMGEVTAAIKIMEDITERVSLESQFRQAQKMEAVGRLAGGVAHDFNNMLSVILGYAELALHKISPGQPLHTDLRQIRTAAQRSTEIIRQLLGFARKQTIDPKPLDLNDTVEGALKMIRRLIGEDIDLIWHGDSDRLPIKMDPTQIEQILANLCVNARDAISDVGTITIETSHVAIDEQYCVNHPGFMPGKYAVLIISDDGCGMDPATVENIFEPFYTTKEIGQGTGLGLATVYGIVKQNLGFISVYSEVGKGTTFKVYFPRHTGDTASESPAATAVPPRSRGETILVVEDEASVLDLTCQMLRNLGYAVLAAASPEDALRIVKTLSDEIHLLVTDVILPKMNGRDLAKKLVKFRPQLKCLFMSGYTADVIANRGILDKGVHFIPKPFSLQDIATKVRAALDD